MVWVALEACCAGAYFGIVAQNNNLVQDTMHGCSKKVCQSLDMYKQIETYQNDEFRGKWISQSQICNISSTTEIIDKCLNFSVNYCTWQGIKWLMAKENKKLKKPLLQIS